MVITFIDYGQLDHMKSPSEIRKFLYYNFWEWWNENAVAGPGHTPYVNYGNGKIGGWGIGKG